MRYLLAVVALATLLPALVYWYLAHGWVDRWRRLAPPVTFGALFAAMAIVGGALWALRRPLLAVRYAWTPWWLVPAAVSLAAAVVVEVHCRRHLSRRTLVGVPELVTGAADQDLLVSGIYGRVRHPRYLAVVLGLLAVACLVHYPVVWLLLPVFTIGLLGVIVLEERELVDRFGDAYREYQRQVPRLLPRRRR